MMVSLVSERMPARALDCRMAMNNECHRLEGCRDE